MSGVNPEPSVKATVIGDVVASRRAPDRRALHRALGEALEATGFAFTVGDEFQGGHPSVGAAIDAALKVRLAVAPEVDIRFGIGWGSVTVLDAETGIQDGPGWWAAREAIEWVASAQRQPGLAAVRTSFRRAADTAGPDVDAVNAALLCRDHLLGSLDDRSMRILKGLLDKHTKKDIAAAEHVSASAVSQRVGRDGLDLLVLTSTYLRGVR
ncbi:RNA polymerase subunit sigma-70 [Mycolicibacterium sp. S2-37]|uniref:SatD family protein n=1 Tax=Mycolicibacterium sp. S2-37 TaxID=2810297 RepID=UPI001A945132|nr:SatD family protein [Mycolicibacterium sp. S2-37]MBO0680875.1 RNA polymerase subunit sigma-70 [Mycolicibacterium sp. S2-37]